ncbi:MAG: 7-carboxy-7-deazaguanine synthase QueE, partial [Bacteroidaceae bacterium]|nr:7-carboxy-7-deazaguanine synthase QueE [Bacteroidaceae bacterium]
MRVNETFLSLQGEGRFTGTPVFFLRLSGCNLQCPFCDTNHQGYKEMSEDEIVQEASQYEPRHIVITGGEPAMQLTQSLVDKL